MEIDLLISLRKVKSISDYQFGNDITDILFENIGNIEIIRSPNTNKIRYIKSNNKLLLSLRPNTGLCRKKNYQKYNCSKIKSNRRERYFRLY